MTMHNGRDAGRERAARASAGLLAVSCAALALTGAAGPLGAGAAHVPAAAARADADPDAISRAAHTGSADLFSDTTATYPRAWGAPDAGATPARARIVVAGEHYRAGGFHRFLLGADYRHLWTTPVEVAELDMRAFAGGLRPVRRVGGQQTRGLAMKGADGRDYTFRSLDKDPSEILPPEFHGTFVDRLLQDQIASSFPGGALAVSPLLEAAGVLHTTPILVVMPDDSLLGGFRPVFAGLLGTLEEFPRAAGDGNPGFAGATEIIFGAELWERMDESPETRPDARAFLTARLVDILIGDWDRHRGQWRWARIPGREGWQPIPEDRDQAFVRFEGLIPAAGRQHMPQFVSFGDDYPGIEGLSWNGRDGDRRILPWLERNVWREVALELQGRITDPVIAEAIARIPPAYRAREGAALETALKSRRDALPEVADRFYRFLARDVDVRATDRSEVATVARADNGDVEVTVALARVEGAAAEPYFRRVFHPDETDEVRIYLGGGADSVVATGTPGKIIVRVMGGDGDDVIDDRAGTRLRVSDAGGANRIIAGRGTKLDTRPYTPPERTKAEWIPPRDWGRRNIFYPWISGSSDLGVLFRAAWQTEGYGFRKDPYADRQTIRLGYATRAGAFDADYRGVFRRENSRKVTAFRARASGLDFLHFYGFGNETEAPADDDFYKVKHTEYVAEPSLLFPMGRHGTVFLKTGAKFTKTDTGENRFIAIARPYGAEDFFQIGLGAGLSVDTRDPEALPASGYHLNVEGTLFPEIGKVESTFGEVHAEAAYYRPLPVPANLVVALRAGGSRIWGDYPWHEAAYIGGSRTVRGLPEQRFAGDASLFGNVELRLPVSRIYVLVPGNMGVFALADVGRVFLEGESSGRWHEGAGGGLWFTFIDPENTASIAVASSDEGTRVYVLAGMAF